MFVLGATSPTHSEPVELGALLNGLGARLEWEPIRQVARVSLGDSEVTFKLGAGTFVLNQSRRAILEPAYRSKGAIMLPQPTALALSAHLTGESVEPGAPRVAVGWIPNPADDQ